jgi:hypothetical protein
MATVLMCKDRKKSKKRTKAHKVNVGARSISPPYYAMRLAAMEILDDAIVESLKAELGRTPTEIERVAEWAECIRLYSH